MIMQMLVHSIITFFEYNKKTITKENEERVPMVDGNKMGTSQNQPGRPHRPGQRRCQRRGEAHRVYHIAPPHAHIFPTTCLRFWQRVYC